MPENPAEQDPPLTVRVARDHTRRTYTPRNKASVGVQYEIPLGAVGFITPRLDASYQSKIFTDVTNTALGTIDSRTLVNGRLTWLSPEKSWQASVECQNLTDKLYYTSKSDGTYNGGGYAFGAPGLPRTVMFEVKRSF